MGCCDSVEREGYLTTQQHNQAARKAFLADMTGRADAEPESLSVELQGNYVPIY